MATDFNDAVELLDTFTDRLEVMLVGVGYGVGGRVCVPGWDAFINSCDDALILEIEMFEDINVQDFMDNDIVEMFHDYCNEYDIVLG